MPDPVNTYGSRAADHVQNIGVNDEWETPPDIFETACEWAGFTPDLDVAATDSNHKCPKYITRDMNALLRMWLSDWWCNPPYSRVADFIKYGLEQSRIHETRGIFLTYAKCDVMWFHDHVVDNPAVKIKFIKGRVKFLKDGVPQGPAPYPSMLLRVEVKA